MPQQVLPTAFTTGSRGFVPEAAVDPQLRYVWLEDTGCDSGDCPEFAQVQVEFEQAPEAPRWLLISSAAADSGRNVRPLRANDAGMHAWSDSVRLPQGDRCIDVRILGVEGVPLFEYRSCEPDSCARSSRAGTRDTCGRLVSVPIDSLELSTGNCGGPAQVDPDDAAGGREMADAGDRSPGGFSAGGSSARGLDATDDATGRRVSTPPMRDDAAAGCHASGAGMPGFGMIAGIVLLVVAAMRRHRRAPSTPSRAISKLPRGL
jgi:hypothetical protein